MKTIPLTQGKFAMVDDADYAELSRFKWYALKGHNTFYAVRNITISLNNCDAIRMHGEILGTNDGIDHWDGNGLNNQRSNLRRATSQQNSRNRRKSPAPSSSKFKGVYWHIRRKKWVAQITFSDKRTYLGLFESEIDAARAYDTAAQKHFGEFCSLNLPL